MKPRIKVHCLAVVDCAAVPEAVIVADIKLQRSSAEVSRYVLLGYEKREGLSRMQRETMDRERTREFYPYLHRTEHGLPTLFRTHLWNATGLIVTDRPLTGEKNPPWFNAESMWVSDELLPGIYQDFTAWRARYPQRDGGIWAPSWNTLWAMQALTIAAAKPLTWPIPTPGDTDDRSMEQKDSDYATHGGSNS